MRLEPVGAHETMLHYTANAQGGGKIAQIGSPLIDMGAQKLAAAFFASFNQALTHKHGVALVALPAAAAPRGAFAGLLTWFKRLFGG